MQWEYGNTQTREQCLHLSNFALPPAHVLNVVYPLFRHKTHLHQQQHTIYWIESVVTYVVQELGDGELALRRVQCLQLVSVWKHTYKVCTMRKPKRKCMQNIGDRCTLFKGIGKKQL